MPTTRPSVTIRRVAPGDAAGLACFYAGLSPDSRVMRFLGACRPPDAARARAFCCVDHACREGFVAVMDAASGERVVGHLCLEPDGEGAAEVAVAVADDLQGIGIGRGLVEAGIAWSRCVGLRELRATAFDTNGRMIALVRGLGLPVRFDRSEAGTCTMRIGLTVPLPTAA